MYNPKKETKSYHLKNVYLRNQQFELNLSKLFEIDKQQNSKMEIQLDLEKGTLSLKKYFSKSINQ